MAEEIKETRGSLLLRSVWPFGFIHVLPLAAIWTDVTSFDWILCGAMYVMRMFFITGGYHRYFAHKTYKTSRVGQFVIAFMAQTSLQKGALWWAAHHRVHHKTSDTVQDPHSMKVYGFWYSHLGWILGPDYKETEYDLIRDFSKFKELVWLNKYHLIPPFTLLLVIWLAGNWVNGGSVLAFEAGVSTFLIGFTLSTAILYHGTFSINSVMHYFGKARYETGDESKNHFLLAIITLGEGWHNNHHYYQSASRQGFFWWEVDITFYILKTLSFFGLVWDLRGVPNHIKYSKNLEHAKELAKEAAEESRGKS